MRTNNVPDFSLDNDDFLMLVKSLGHYAQCDCLTAEEALHVADLIRKIEGLTDPTKDLKHLGSDWDTPAVETDFEL